MHSILSSFSQPMLNQHVRYFYHTLWNTLSFVQLTNCSFILWISLQSLGIWLIIVQKLVLFQLFLMLYQPSKNSMLCLGIFWIFLTPLLIYCSSRPNGLCPPSQSQNPPFRFLTFYSSEMSLIFPTPLTEHFLWLWFFNFSHVLGRAICSLLVLSFLHQNV